MCYYGDNIFNNDVFVKLYYKFRIINCNLTKNLFNK